VSKPYGPGDKGQRYEVRYQLKSASGEDDPTYPIGWYKTLAGAESLKESIQQRPAFCNPVIVDRKLYKD
jgi:hypothetical protein